MLNDDTPVDGSPLLRVVELKPAETEQVAGGSPTLPLPPPYRASLGPPDPIPW